MMAHLRERECGRVENGFETRNVSRRPIFRHRIGPISVRSWPVFSGKSLMSREAEYHKADNIFRPVALQRLTRCGVSHAGSRSEEHTSELQSLMRISYAVFCLKKNKEMQNKTNAK